MTVYPEDLKYSTDHEWIRTEPDGVVACGITDYAQDALGDIVFVTLPEPGTPITAGDSVGEVESTKSVSDLYAPVSGTVVARNDALDSTPEVINSDPYGEGWMLRIQVDDPGSLDGLLSASGYADHVASSS